MFSALNFPSQPASQDSCSCTSEHSTLSQAAAYLLSMRAQPCTATTLRLQPISSTSSP
jgi:hypothetical protein